MFFWKERLKMVFPNRNYNVSLINNFDGEIGQCIVLYEN